MNGIWLAYWALSFFVGAIPFGYLLAKLFGGVDIRKKGSGNIGATNVTRLLGWKVGLPVLLLDIGKGAIAPLVGIYLLKTEFAFVPLVAGVLSVLGHMFSPFLLFKGGKGVATSFGVFLVLTPFPVLVSLFVFLVLKKGFGFVSLGSIGGAIVLPISYYLFSIYSIIEYEAITFYAICAVSCAILFLHRTNLVRLFKGRELLSNKEKYGDQNLDE
ncbi:acyl-phosphate glycerol 3-phosphate acyltransferase [Leptospira perolatii]|uniref:Glycerol-3-phosphate acyltransferase n=1 Tax=Leptospira perolatii TaxID=2023191 RepID=A0A2M9ZL61_9LEPT|nr:glycerol-3-phosphate 1-O-acyltransferase PlsY [Leptospira perolatii]PJZ70351.1 acyl-phosphate glycerol 3-phosphate acyltransferase [Leptospira perolatii]PJZ72765.1 acyl-phosphate glycerol 3-phosphate acyltransferase [Leptospira perolatii]